MSPSPSTMISNSDQSISGDGSPCSVVADYHASSAQIAASTAVTCEDRVDLALSDYTVGGPSPAAFSSLGCATHIGQLRILGLTKDSEDDTTTCCPFDFEPEYHDAALIRQALLKHLGDTKIDTLILHYSTTPGFVRPRPDAFAHCRLLDIKADQVLQTSCPDAENPDFFLFRHDLSKTDSPEFDRSYSLGCTSSDGDFQDGIKEIFTEILYAGRKGEASDFKFYSPESFVPKQLTFENGNGRKMPKQGITLQHEPYTRALSKLPTEIKDLLPGLEG